MRRKDFGTLSLSPAEREQLDQLAAYFGLDPWKSPAALCRGVLHHAWLEFCSLTLTPEQREAWKHREDQEIKAGISGYGYASHTRV